MFSSNLNRQPAALVTNSGLLQVKSVVYEYVECVFHQ